MQASEWWAADSTDQEERRLANSLGRYRCFYHHNEETLGPVTVWRVRELIETGVLEPDVQVILEGTDFWHTYAEQELKIAPPPAKDITEALHQAAELQCFYYFRNEILGPTPLLVILHKVRMGKLPADVQICADGTESAEDWKRVCDISIS